MTRELPPTLELRGLVLGTERGPLTCEALATGHGNVACLGAARALVRAFVEPDRLRRGRILCRNRELGASLAELAAGFVPHRLAGDPELDVKTTLLLGARLLGLGASDVQLALERAHAAGFQKERLNRLSPLQERLSGLAHGLLGRPPLLIIEDPYVELDDDGAAALEELLDPELETHQFITSVEADSPWSRRLLARADQVITAAGGGLLGPFAPVDLPVRGLWLQCREPGVAQLVDALRAAKAEVTPTPRPGVLFVRGLGGLQILQLAEAAGAQVEELSPSNP